MSIDTQLEKMLRKVEKPARYTGGEVNSVKKDPEQVVRFGFAFPEHLRDRHVVWACRFYTIY